MKMIFTSVFISIVCFFANAAVAEETVSSDEALRVSTKRLDELLYRPEHSAMASVVSLNRSSISAQINARIQMIHVKAGDKVKKLDPLMMLDCTDAKLAQAQALANLEHAKKELRRLEKLQQADAVTEQSYNLAQTQVSITRISYKQASHQVSRCIVVAPFDGVVVDRLTSVGELATVGTPLINLVDTTTIEVDAALRHSQSQQLIRAKNIYFSWANEQYPVSIRKIVKVLDPTNRTLTARLVFDSQKALPGASGRIHWIGNVKHLPEEIIVKRNGQLGVFIYENGKAVFVKLLDAKLGFSQVIDLPGDTLVITKGRNALTDGDLIADQGQ